MQVRMKSGLVGHTRNHKPGDIVEVEAQEGERWIKYGLAVAVGTDAKFEKLAAEVVEIAARSAPKETATRRRAKVEK